MFRLRSLVTTLAVGALLLPAGLSGQTEERSWSVDVIGGAQIFPESSSLETGGVIGVSSLYQITRNFSIGPAVEFVRTSTDGSWFVAAIDFGVDSTRIFNVGQRISVLQYGGNARFDFSPDNKLNPYVTGGIGATTMYLEAQSNDNFRRINNLMLSFGGGFRYAITEGAGIQIDVRDMIYSDFDRAALNPIQERDRNRKANGDIRFPAAERPDFEAADETLHNIRLSIGLVYIPGRGG